MIQVSVITPTCRNGGIDVMASNLLRQDFDLSAVEWILVDELYSVRSKPVLDFVGEYLPSLGGFTHLMAPEHKPDTVNNLHQSYNAALRHSTGEHLCIIQDYIWIPEHTLQRLVGYSAGKNLVSAVGNKYLHHDPLSGCDIDVDSHGVSIFDHLCDHKPDGPLTFTDPRITGCFQCRYAITCGEWESNICIIPRRVIVDQLGGYDEELDEGWACDNVDVAARAEYLGIPIYVAEDVLVMGMEHNVWFPNKINVPEYYQHNVRRVNQQLSDIWSGRKDVRYNHT